MVDQSPAADPVGPRPCPFPRHLKPCNPDLSDTVTTAKSADATGAGFAKLCSNTVGDDACKKFTYIFVQLDVGHEGPPRRLVAAHDADVFVHAVALR